ncbi:MAG: nitroreductase family deazaflavin-dependent oxidoreductase [Candidatus Binatia bacterium]
MSEKAAKPYTAGQAKLFKTLLIKPLSQVNTWLYRLSSGKVGGRMPQGQPILLLTTTGRKSGQPRTTPLLYLQEGDNVVLVASQGGLPHHPLWYQNLEVNPDVEIELGTEKRAMRARRATEEEKKTLWPKLVAMYGSFDTYQARTQRNIPVVILSPR